MAESEKKIIYYRESLIQSVLSDLFSWITLGIFLYMNHVYFGDHVFIAALLLILWIILVLARSSGISKVFTNKKDLIDYIEKTIK